MKKYEYVVFDFNGTIIDDVQLCLDLLNKMLKEKGLKPVTKEEYKNIFTFPIIEYYKKAGFTFDGYTFQELSLEFIKDYQPASYKCDLFPHIKEILSFLNKEGYHVILLSASERNNLIAQTDNFGITKDFETILGLDNIHATSKIAIGKEYFLKNNIDAKKALFVGDSLHDVEVASAIGGDIVLVSYGHQNEERLLTSGKKVISSIEEIKSLL
jgi:phosphoglycolate phosphatase